MPILETTYRALHDQDMARQRREHQDMINGQKFFDTQPGQMALCKALTHHARHHAPLEIMKELEERHLAWPVHMQNKSLWITPEEFFHWNKARIPTKDQMFKIISTALTKNGSRKFYWQVIDRQYYDQAQLCPKWRYCTTDMDIAPITAMAEYNKLWAEYKNFDQHDHVRANLHHQDQDDNQWDEELAHRQEWPQAPTNSTASTSTTPNKIAK